MSSKSRPVEYGGIVWKVVPGSRREQLLLRFIEQDRALHGTVPLIDDDPLFSTIWGLIGLLVGAAAVSLAWWLL